MATVLEVAAYIKKHCKNVEPDDLQCLCYLAQGWYLGWTGRSMFKDEIEARETGPLCETLDKVLRTGGKLPKSRMGNFTDGMQKVLKAILSFYVSSSDGNLTDEDRKNIKEEVMLSLPFKCALDKMSNGKVQRVNRECLHTFYKEITIEKYTPVRLGGTDISQHLLNAKLKEVRPEKVLFLTTELKSVYQGIRILKINAIYGTGAKAMDLSIRIRYAKGVGKNINYAHMPTDIRNIPKTCEKRKEIESVLWNASVIVGFGLPVDLKRLSEGGIRLSKRKLYIDLERPFVRICSRKGLLQKIGQIPDVESCAKILGANFLTYSNNGEKMAVPNTDKVRYSYNKMITRVELPELAVCP